jgi:hypothetical protein
MNFLAGELVEIGEQECVVKLTSGDTVRARVDARSGAVGDKVELGIRPEHLVPLDHAHADSKVSGVVQVAEHLGAESFVYMDVDGHDFTVKASSDIDVATGQSTASAFRPKPATCSMPKSRRSRARPNISAPEGESARFSFYTFNAFCRSQDQLFIARHPKWAGRVRLAGGHCPACLTRGRR